MSDEEKKTIETNPEEPQPEKAPEQQPAQEPETSSESETEQQVSSLPSEPQQAPDNIIQIPEDPNLIRQKKRRQRRYLLLAGVVLLTVIVLLFVLLPDVFDTNAIRRYFHYMGNRDREGFGEFSFDAAGTNDFATLGDGMALGTEGGLYFYNLSGEQVSMVQSTVTAPRMLTNGSEALCWSMGSSYLAIINNKGERLMDQTLGGTLLDVDLSSDGYVCYNLTEKGYKTVTTVLNRAYEPMYRFRSSTQHLNACAVSEGGAFVAVAGLAEENGSFTSTLTILRTDEELIAGTDQSQTAKYRMSLGNQVVYEMAFLSKNRLCVIAQDALLLVDEKCETVAEIPFDTSYLRGYSISDSGYVALLLGQSMTGDRCELRTVNKNGETVGSVELNRPVRSLHACGKFVGVLTNSALLVYRENLHPYRECSEVGTATRVLMREDGTALLVSNDTSKLYIP